MTEACSAKGISSAGSFDKPAEESFKRFCLAASSLNRELNEVVVHSVARSVLVAAFRIDTQFG